MTADLSALIARLEAAEVGSRELDGAIHRIFLPDDLIMTDAGSVGPVKRPSKREALRDVPHIPDKVISEMLCVPYWTTSIDAALALAERVYPGFGLGCVQGSGERCAANVTPDGWASGVSGIASAPALAICIAILRAKQGEGE